MGFFLAQASVREPLVFDSHGNLLSAPHTESLIRTFLEQAIDARFSSKTDAPLNLLSPKMRAHRESEQLELSRSGVDQKVLVRTITINEDGANILSDKILAMGKLRSALHLSLTVEFRAVPRTQSNPFGLILTDCNTAQEKTDE